MFDRWFGLAYWKTGELAKEKGTVTVALRRWIALCCRITIDQAPAVYPHGETFVHRGLHPLPDARHPLVRLGALILARTIHTPPHPLGH